ncbi:FAD-binding oxidoreductase [Phenylobacterium soli]|uniref:FAD-binding oxidoreductase n=1 Tax=Phenylobacterium soli TaxID=2170551 RepID=A0A328AQ21_9CAUL|nr:FAD-binding oxidoreductase [Phenylobacterium soli]RAK54978.1 FAD-binding oxidoreductase [Phenylobacterium soli]
MSDIVEALTAAFGATEVITGEAARERARSGWARLGAPLAIVRPRTTAEVSTILRLAHDHRQPVVPWGGLTGLVEGAYAEGAVALSLERMRAVREVDPVERTLTVEAGCPLESAAAAAEAAGLFLPIDIGARGSATVGGAISTNAGGNRVLRWGMMRESVLGLEAVLADGEVVTSLNTLVKNNAGYDLKHLFIGSEGTLGLVTRAVLRLRPRPTSQATAFVAVNRFDALPALLSAASAGLGGTLSAFEVMWADFYDLVTTPPAQGRAPLPRGAPYYVLLETLGSDAAADGERLETVLGEALAFGTITDAAIAKSEAERNAMWALRDDVGQTARNGPIYAFDVSLRIGEMEAYVAQVRAALGARWGEAASLTVFGHLGDGNLHLIAGVGARSPELQQEVEAAVYGPLASIGGSISAEHGVGLQKRAFLHLSRSPAEIALMRRLKTAMDPQGILNPGKIIAT